MGSHDGALRPRDLQDILFENFLENDTDKVLLQVFMEKGIQLLVIEVEKNHPKVFGRIDPEPDRARLLLLYMLRAACYRLIREAENVDLFASCSFL